MLLPAVALGVDGAIGSTYNVNGIRARQIFDLVREGKLEEANEIQNVTNDFISDVINNGIYNTLKLILQERGIDAGYCREPFKAYTKEQIEKSKEISNKYF